MPRASTMTVDSSSRPSRGRSCQNEDRVGRGETAVDMSSMVARTTDTPQTVIRRAAPSGCSLSAGRDPTYSGGVDLAVGFDLDMTLVDSSDGIVATVPGRRRRGRHTSRPAGPRRHHRHPDGGHARALPAAPSWCCPVADRYRELYPAIGVPRTVALPGAAEAFAAVRAAARPGRGGQRQARTRRPAGARPRRPAGGRRRRPAVRRRQGRRAARARRQRLPRRPPRRRRWARTPQARRPSRWPPGRTTRRRSPRPARTSSCPGSSRSRPGSTRARARRAAGRPARAAGRRSAR